MLDESVRFAAVARRYCTLVETAQDYPLHERLGRFAMLLAELYAAAFGLPEVEPTGRLFPKVQRKPLTWPGFGHCESYWEVPDPYTTETPRTAGLSDHVLDVYGDVKLGLVQFDAGSEDDVVNATWTWRFLFGPHWGDHATDALRALHRGMWGFDDSERAVREE